MIIPINNGRTIIPLYIPTPSTNSQQTIQQTTQQTNNSEPIDWSNPGAWVVILVVVGFIVVFTKYFAKLLKEITGGEDG